MENITTKRTSLHTSEVIKPIIIEEKNKALVQLNRCL